MKFLAAFLALACTSLAAPPSITSIQVSTLDANTGAVRLSTTVESGGEFTTVKFSYRPVGKASIEAEQETIGAAVASQSFTRDFTNLLGGKTYEFTVEASQGDGDKDTEVRTWEIPKYPLSFARPTRDPAPVVTSLNGEVTLNGLVTPNGDNITELKIARGDETSGSSYKLSIPATVTLPITSANVYEPVPFSGKFTGLIRGATYHYQFQATTDGTPSSVNSLDYSFVMAANRAPVAGADFATIRKDQPVTIDVLKNDIDPDGDQFSLVPGGITQGKQGSVAIVNGKIVYTPSADSKGNDTFTYTIQDNYTGPEGSEPNDDLRKTAIGTVSINAPGLKARGLQSADLKDEAGNLVGLVRIIGTGGGSVTGKVQLFTKTYTVSGEVGADGHFYFTIPQDDGDSLQLDINYGEQGNEDFDVSLKSSEESWTGNILANNLTSERRDQIVGKYTLEFPAAGGDGEPQGIGFARVEVKPWGEVSVKGRFGDGTKFSTRGVLAGSDSAPQVLLYYAKGETRFSLPLSFGAEAGANPSGPLRWYQAPDGGAQFFPNGFYVEGEAAGSPFTPPDKNRTLPNSKLATLTLSEGNIRTTITQNLEISKSDRVNFTTANPYNVSLNINRDNGTFKGQFDHPFDNSRRTFNGVLLQSQDKGSGVFTGIDQSGAIALSMGATTPVPTPQPTPNPTPTPTPTTPTPNPIFNGGNGLNLR